MNIITKTPFVIAAILALGVANAEAVTSKTIDQHFKVDFGQRIEIKGFSGSHIRFTSWDKPEVYIHLTVSISASNEKYEKNFIDAVRIDERRSADVVSISFDDASKSIEHNRTFWEDVKSLFGGMRSVSREVEGEIYVPASNDLSANIPYANVSLENMNGNLRFTGSSNELSLRNCTLLQSVSNDYGTTTIHNSGGNLTLKGQSSTITVEDFDGALACDAPYAKLRFMRIKKPLTVRSQSGEVTIEDVRGDVTLASDYSPVSVTNVSGFADITSQSGTIKVRQVDGVRVKADYSRIEIARVTGKSNRDIIIEDQSGSVTLEDVVGNLRIDAPYSRIQMKDVKGNVRLSTQSGTVTGEDIAGDWDSKTEYSTVRVTGLAAKQVRATNSSNPLTFNLTTVPSSIHIQNEYANVAVNMPKGFGGDVNLDVEYGSIESNLPVKVRNKSNSGYAVGKVGVGSGSITIETMSGKISLMEK